jgi:hypothetical protein
MSEPGPTWAVETIKRVANGQRRHPRLWRLVTEILHEASRLAHLVEDPPAGRCDNDVLRRIAAIRRPLDDAVMLIVFAEGDDHATD